MGRLRSLLVATAVAATTATALGPLAATTPVAAATAAPSVDPYSRASVLAGYRSGLVEPRAVAPGWTGDAATCRTGTESAASIDATRAAVNYYRALNRLPAIALEPSKNAKALAAATMMHANGRISHTPPTTWRCYTPAAAGAAGTSNLAQGAVGARAVDLYMADQGASNTAAGHRRWLLHPAATTFGTGSTSGFNALTVIGGATAARPAEVSWVAWPNAGFVPKRALRPSAGGAATVLFSLSSSTHPDASYAGASVTVKVGSTALPVAVHPAVDGYGDDTLTWDVTPPAGYDTSDADVRFDITVSGVETASGRAIPTRSYSSTAIVTAVGATAAPYAPYSSWTHLVDQVFRQLVGRRPAAAERTQWLGPLEEGTKSPGDLVAALRRSSHHTAIVDPVTRLYRSYYLRNPDRGGLEYWVAQRLGGRSLVSISAFFARSSEFAELYGARTDREFVELIYQNILGRPGEPAGVTYWTDEITSRRRGRGAVMLGFSESGEYRTSQASEVTVSVLHLMWLDRAPTGPELARGVAALDEGRSVADYAETLRPHAAVVA